MQTDELKLKYGSYITEEGIEIVFTEWGFLSHEDNIPCYTAHGICASHGEYQIYWDILDLESFPTLEDESQACDWDNPTKIVCFEEPICT